MKSGKTKVVRPSRGSKSNAISAWNTYYKHDDDGDDVDDDLEWELMMFNA